MTGQTYQLLFCLTNSQQKRNINYVFKINLAHRMSLVCAHVCVYSYIYVYHVFRRPGMEQGALVQL